MPNQKIVTEAALSAIASDIKNALSGKANSNDVYPKSQTYNRTEIDNALALKADKSELYNVYPTDQESGAIAHFTDGANNIPVKSLVSEIVAVESGSGEKSPTNPYTISGFSSGVISVNSNTYTFAFGQTVYGGHFDNKGNLVVTEEHKIFNGTENWQKSSSGNVYYFSSNRTDFPYSTSTPTKNICNSYVFKGFTTGSYVSYLNDGEYLLYGYVGSGATREIAFRYDNITTLEDWKTALTNSPIEIVFVLANPITLAISSQDIPTLLGENNIFSNCGDVKVNYCADIGLYIDKKISSLAQA